MSDFPAAAALASGRQESHSFVLGIYLGYALHYKSTFYLYFLG